MKNYIKQYIRESQINYPSIFPKPINVLKHLFFTNGNGYEIVNGNPVEYVDFGRYVKLEDYYSSYKSYEDCLEYYKEYKLDANVNESFRSRKGWNDKLKESSSEALRNMYKDDDELYKAIYQDAINDLNNIEVLDDSRINDVEYWIDQIKDCKYFPLLRLYEGFYDLGKFNIRTESSLLKLSKIIVNAYIKFYDNINDEDLEKYLWDSGPRLSNALDHKEELDKILENDLSILRKEYSRLSREYSEQLFSEC